MLENNTLSPSHCPPPHASTLVILTSPLINLHPYPLYPNNPTPPIGSPRTSRLYRMLHAPPPLRERPRSADLHDTVRRQQLHGLRRLR